MRRSKNQDMMANRAKESNMQAATPKANPPANILTKIAGSVTLARLIDEVRNEDLNVARSYDRTHNRHNR